VQSQSPNLDDNVTHAAVPVPGIASVVRNARSARDRRAANGNATAAMCLLTKGNDAELDEWVSYHLGLGFDEIYIFDNSGSNALRRWAMAASWAVAQHGGEQHHGLRVDVEPWPDPNDHIVNASKQRAAYTHCVEHYLKPRGITWLALFDVDEFLVLNEHSSVVPFLIEWSPPRGSVVVHWVVFGTSNLTRADHDVPVTWHFQHPVRKIAHPGFHTIKSIARVDDFEDMRGSPHSVWFTKAAFSAETVQVDTLGRTSGAMSLSQVSDDSCVQTESHS